MDNKVLSFEQFLKHKSPSEEVKGTSEIVKDHYDSEKDGDLSNPKHGTVKGNGSVDHTEEIKADDLSDPKEANVGKHIKENSQDLKSELQDVLNNNSEGIDIDDARDMMNKMMSSHPGKDDLIEEFFILMVALEGEYDEYHNSGESKYRLQRRIDSAEQEIYTLLTSIK